MVEIENLVFVIGVVLLAYLISQILLLVLFGKRIIEGMSEEERRENVLHFMPFVVVLALASIGINIVIKFFRRVKSNGDV